MNEESKEGKTGKDTDRLSLPEASEFAREKDYERERKYIDGLKDILGPRPSYQLREALYMKLFQKNGSWDFFMKLHWPRGNAPKGQKRVTEYNEIAEGFLSYLQDVAEGRRPYDEIGIGKCIVNPRGE